eukprot:215145_1
MSLMSCATFATKIQPNVSRDNVIHTQFETFKGWDEANANFSGLTMSPTLGLNEMQSMLQEQSQDVYKFGFGQSPMPVPQCLVNKLIEYAHIKDYLPVQGLYKLRESISNHYNNKILNINSNIEPENIIVTPGTKQAFFLLKLALNKTSEILLPSPSWVTYKPQAHMLDKNIAWIETSYESNWKILPKTMDNYLRNNTSKQRLLILNSPSNPTGAKYTYDELIELANICNKYGVYVLSDEIYGDLYHNNNDKYFSLYDIYPNNTIISNGLSKAFGAGGWRLGFLIFPPNMKWLLDAVFIASSETHTSVSAPMQYAACEAFDTYNSNEIQNYLAIKRKILSGLSLRFYNLLKDINGCNVVKPDGGFYIFPDFTNVKNINNMINKWSKETGKNINEWNSNEFSMYLLKETGVAGLGGHCFGRNSNELSMRLSFVDFDGAKLLKELDVNKCLNEIHVESHEMDLVLEQFCEKTMKGMQVLHDYM